MPSGPANRFSVAGKAKSSARNRVSRAGKTSFPPDIAVEIDITKDSLFKFHIYAALKEPLRWTRARSSDRAKRSRRSAKASPSSILLLGNHGRRRGNRFSRVEKRHPTQEIAFPVWEKQNAAQEIAFPVWEKQNAAQEIAFPVWEKQNAAQEIAFPVWEKRNPTQEIPFPACRLWRIPSPSPVLMPRAKVSPR